MNVQFFANVALVISVLGCVAFVALYQFSANWRNTPLGRNVMAFMAVCAILLTLSAIRNFTHLLDHHLEILRLVSFASVGYIVWRRTYLLFRAQMTSRSATRLEDARRPYAEEAHEEQADTQSRERP